FVREPEAAAGGGRADSDALSGRPSTRDDLRSEAKGADRRGRPQSGALLPGYYASLRQRRRHAAAVFAQSRARPEPVAVQGRSETVHLGAVGGEAQPNVSCLFLGREFATRRLAGHRRLLGSARLVWLSRLCARGRAGTRPAPPGPAQRTVAERTRNRRPHA